MLPRDTDLINQVKAIILKHARPTRIYLHGSMTTGEAKPGSDIDIAYDDPDFKDNYLIKDEIENIATLVKVDVQNMAHSEDRFKNRVKSTGSVLYSATKLLRAEDGLHNFTKALDKFINIVDREDEFRQNGYGDIYLDLLVKRFEFTYEMSWKALKRYLDFTGIVAASPRAVFKEAYAQQVITDEACWLSMIEDRNLSSHIYDESEIAGLLYKKDRYKQAFVDLRSKLYHLLQEYL